ncbi:histidine kinase [Nostocales cyanobacterium HT-58-2]|nr:histidine kinase [Nostocales cyanobacterium HT-58-2]
MPSIYPVDLPTIEQVMESYPLTVLPNTLLVDVIALMNPVNSSTVDSASDFSSCVLVVEENTLVGIFTLRDVVRLTGAGVDLFRVKISEVMTQPVISLTRAAAQNALTALAFMRQHHIRHLPVVNEQGQLLGLITQDRIRQVIQPAHLLKLRCVTEVMVREVIHALPTISVLELSQMMSDRRISCVVIVAPQETKLIPVGMITEKDILKVQLQGLDMAQTQVQAVMSTPVLSINPSESLLTVHQLMQEQGVRRVAVVDEQGELQGLVTQTNLLQVLDPLEIVSIIQALQTKVEEQTVQLRQTNQQLEQEVRQRRQVEESLCQAQQELELRVLERTDGLVQANARLQAEIEERTKAETELQLTKFCIDRATDASACIDLNGRYVYVNDTMCHTLNYSREELLLMSVYDINVDISTPAVWADFWQKLKQQGFMVFESHHRRRDGQINPVEITTNYFKFQGQEFLWGFARNITGRKQAEAALRASQQQLQAIIDNSPAVIYVKDVQGQHILVNSEFERITHLTREQVKNKTDYELFSPDIAQALSRNDQNVLTSLTPLQFEEEVELDDRLHTYITVKFPLCDADGQPYGICGISTDITARKQAQQQIREQAVLIDIATDAFVVRDLENRILFWSQGAERLYGWTAEESLGKKTHELFHTQPLSQVEAALKTTVEQGFWEGEFNKTTKNGSNIIVASRWTLVHNQFGQTQSILVVDTDITDKKQLEQQFYRAQRLESVGTLASGIAHDLNNVFAPIMMIAQLLTSRCKNVDARTQELFKTLENSSKRGADLVKQILTFARGTEGKQILLQPGHLLKELVKVIQQTFPKSIEIVTDIPTNTLWMVQADPTQLDQVFMNLAVNARDAMPNGGRLIITAENRIIDETYARMHLEAEAGDYIVVTISDTGTGIPPEILERIFDPFFTTKEVGKGTGLGLSTVLGIVKNHGGFVEVASQVSQGTQFQVFLPRGEGTATKATAKTELPRGNGELILVVDDEKIVHQTTQETLTDYDYKTLVANDGIEAIALYVEYQPEISAVLLDMLMPNMDGLTAIRTLRTINPNVKIVATSGLHANEQKAIAAGADKFLSKPYTTTDLLTTLSDVIGVKK